jgi:hypothetical protein
MSSMRGAQRSSAPSAWLRRSTSRTCGVSGCGKRTSVTRKPSAVPYAVVARAWCEPVAPTVISRSAPRRRASASRNSSFRTLLPP